METGRSQDHFGYQPTNIKPMWHSPVKINLTHSGALLPKQGSALSAGYDLYSAEALDIQPGEIAKVPLGFATEMDPDIHCRIESRSGLASRGLVVLTGVIDADYRGEWSVILMNVGKEVHRVAKGDRVAQGVFRPNVHVSFQEVSELSDTRRGAGGFGSTGR
jgi:dUTP pyrophosphatase